MKHIIECMDGISPATSMNTMGMGNPTMPTDTEVGSGDMLSISKPGTVKKLKKRKKMKRLKEYVNESQNFVVNKKLNNRQDKYEYHPKTKDELQDIIVDLLKLGETNLNCIDVSNITDLGFIFNSVNTVITVKNIDISEWDVSNVKSLCGTFLSCKEFNSDLSNWDVSNVVTMEMMFNNCWKFNSDLSRWNVSKVTDMSRMFVSCNEFNSDLSNWNVLKVKNMSYMFAGCKKFKCDLSNWKICKDTPTRDMFKDCDALEKNNKIPKWYSN